MFADAAAKAKRKSQRRARTTERRILDKPAEIILHRSGRVLDPQIVRIEGANATSATSVELSNMFLGHRNIVIFGFRDHATMPDFDVKVGDEFGHNEANYRVTGFTLHAGEIQASAERIQPA